MPYTPLDSDLLTSTVLKEGPDVVACWMLILASMDKLGETSLQPSAAASLLRISDARADKAFEVLARPDRRSRNQEHGGRRILKRPGGMWAIVGAEKYQQKASRAAATERQRRYVERKAKREKGVCEIDECGNQVSGEIDGQKVCSRHAFGMAEGGTGGRKHGRDQSRS